MLLVGAPKAELCIMGFELVGTPKTEVCDELDILADSNIADCVLEIGTFVVLNNDGEVVVISVFATKIGCNVDAVVAVGVVTVGLVVPKIFCGDPKIDAVCGELPNMDVDARGDLVVSNMFCVDCGGVWKILGCRVADDVVLTPRKEKEVAEAKGAVVIVLDSKLAVPDSDLIGEVATEPGCSGDEVIFVVVVAKEIVLMVKFLLPAVKSKL